MVDYIALFETGYDPSPTHEEGEGGALVRLWPEGEPLTSVGVPDGAALAKHLGWPAEDAETLAMCARHVEHITTLVHSRTRGRGFGVTAATCAPDLAEIILSAAARSVADPTGARRVEVGTVVTSPTPFTGWTLAEQAVLSRYRPTVG